MRSSCMGNRSEAFVSASSTRALGDILVYHAFERCKDSGKWRGRRSRSDRPYSPAEQLLKHQ